MSHVFPRHTKTLPPVAVRGEGCYLIDRDGKRYFDGSGGAAVSCLGHCDPEIIEAIKAQLDRLEFAHTGFFSSEPSEALADYLIEFAPDGIDRVFFVAGGSEAVESALKLARQYVIEKGEPGRHRLISRRQSYHGSTLGALAAGGNAWRREPYAPLLIETSQISPCFEYRGKREDESPVDYGMRVADELETEILALGPETVMAFIAEPVVGGTAGAVPAVPGYFERIREICDRYGVLLILDEVMCGTGRTGTLFASEQDGVTPDIVTIAKGLGAGYQSLGAMLCSKAIYETIEQGSGFFQHGHTYLGHPVATAAGLAVLKAIIERDLLSNVQDKAAKLKQALQTTFGQHPHIGDIRGRGLFQAMEFVEDHGTKQPFDPALGINKKFKKAAFDAGLVCYPMGGTIDGARGDHVLLAPPFIIEDHHIDEMVTKLDKALKATLS